jgi:hypothetical protein
VRKEVNAPLLRRFALKVCLLSPLWGEERGEGKREREEKT